MHQKSTAEAAALIDAAYSGRLDHILANHEPGAQAFITPDRDLVIPGSNEIMDWSGFNIRVHNLLNGRIPNLQLVPQTQTRAWHFGFLKHADSIYRFARHHRPRFIVGHSLGGAAAQIIGHRMGIPTVTFGAPRTHKGRRKKIVGEGWVLNLCRADDPVTGLPVTSGFRHIGTVRTFKTGRAVWPGNHPIAKYASLIAAETGERYARIETAWPRVT